MAYQSPKPLPTPLAMSSATNQPSPSPIPNRPLSPSLPSQKNVSIPHPKHRFPKPKLRLHIEDLNDPAIKIFLSCFNPAFDLSAMTEIVISTLYKPNQVETDFPPVRSITLILHSFAGVAYTTGMMLDEDHKEIHFSLQHILNTASDPPNLQRDEIHGVLVHEMVHCWQWNALATAPSGLIEGIADFVRLEAGLIPPHWRRDPGETWDSGYEKTGFFLHWLEQNWGEGTVRRINHRLKEKKYEEEEFWNGLFGQSVQTLWEKYCKDLAEAVENGSADTQKGNKTAVTGDSGGNTP